MGRENSMKLKWLGLIAILVANTALAQQMQDMILQTAVPSSEGWQGFKDLGFLINAFLNLLLAAFLGATIAYHPRHTQTADTLEEIEASQIYILYAVIGSIIGILVIQYGMGVGFVLFGIGGLIRFRTVLRSASLTGRLIFVTLIGLSAGLDLPHVAILVTVFGFCLIYLLDARFTFRVDIRGLSPENVIPAAAASLKMIEQADCRIVSVKKNPERGRVAFIIQSTDSDLCQRMEETWETKIHDTYKGFVDWEIE